MVFVVVLYTEKAISAANGLLLLYTVLDLLNVLQCSSGPRMPLCGYQLIAEAAYLGDDAYSPWPAS